MKAGKCRVCGCTDNDCRGCIERIGEPCQWDEPDLCTACTGHSLITQERLRHIDDEGFTSEHDDEHRNGELAAAAVCYAMHPLARKAKREYRRLGADDRMVSGMQSLLDFFWPWERKWWRPTPRRRVRELVKAGALIAAEIDRLQRTGGRKGRSSSKPGFLP